MSKFRVISDGLLALTIEADKIGYSGDPNIVLLVNEKGDCVFIGPLNTTRIYREDKTSERKPI